MTPVGLLASLVLPESIMHSHWFAVLTMFVAINTVVYLTLAVIKLLPKAYLSDWVDQRNKRSESRSIYPEVEHPTRRQRRRAGRVRHGRR
jgi:hypothetical protein